MATTAPITKASVPTTEPATLLSHPLPTSNEPLMSKLPRGSPSADDAGPAPSTTVPTKALPPQLTPGSPPNTDGVTPRGMCMLYLTLKFTFLAIALGLCNVADAAKMETKLEYLQSSGLYVFAIGAVLFKWLNDLAVLNQYGFRVSSGADIPNMLAYCTESGETVLLHTDGQLGLFNRAGRAHQNFHEYAAITLGLLGVTSFVFPVYAAWLLTAFVAGRIVYIHGYTQGTAGRVPGYLLANFVGLQMLESFVTVIACVLVSRVGAKAIFFG